MGELAIAMGIWVWDIRRVIIRLDNSNGHGHGTALDYMIDYLIINVSIDNFTISWLLLIR